MELTEEILGSFEKNGMCSIVDFLNEEQTNAIRTEIETLENSSHFKKAGIGREDNYQIDHSRRGDFISWIDQAHSLPATGIFIDKINQVILQLNRTFYLGIRDYECHYAVYPEGTYYEKHSDRHQQHSHRKVSFVFYLNKNWKVEDGGELKIFHDHDRTSIVNPCDGTLALFLSEIEHEVLMTHRRRMSITGWMLDEKII